MIMGATPKYMFCRRISLDNMARIMQPHKGAIGQSAGVQINGFSQII